METLIKQLHSLSNRNNQKPFIGKQTIQRKLSIGSSNDVYEQEADAMADQVVNRSDSQINTTSNSGPLVQRKCADCEEDILQKKSLASEITPLVQRKGQGTEAHSASQALTQQINANQGCGRSMDKSTQNFMESRFGTDFSGVRIHTDFQAGQMSQELNAQAFTVGNDIYFNEGKYNPNSNSGKHLLAHELTHTIQQKGLQRKIQKQESNSDSNKSLIGTGTSSEFDKEIKRLEEIVKKNPQATDLAQLNKLKRYRKNRWDSKLKDCPIELKFNGIKLEVTGSESKSFGAISGSVDKKEPYFDYSKKRQRITGGPIPEGKYWIDPNQLVYWRMAIKRWAGEPSTINSWGTHRITIHPFSSTQTFGRGGFFIHGGTKWGSIGCIDLKDGMENFADVIDNYSGCKIKLTVKYEGSKAVIRNTKTGEIVNP